MMDADALRKSGHGTPSPSLPTPGAAHRCDNCGADWTTEQLEEIADYAERVCSCGTYPEPSGECHECGALCYEQNAALEKWQREERVRAAAPDLLAQLEAVDRWLLDADNPRRWEMAVYLQTTVRAAIARATGT